MPGSSIFNIHSSSSAHVKIISASCLSNIKLKNHNSFLIPSLPMTQNYGLIHCLRLKCSSMWDFIMSDTHTKPQLFIIEPTKVHSGQLEESDTVQWDISRSGQAAMNFRAVGVKLHQVTALALNLTPPAPTALRRCSQTTFTWQLLLTSSRIIRVTFPLTVRTPPSWLIGYNQLPLPGRGGTLDLIKTGGGVKMGPVRGLTPTTSRFSHLTRIFL